MRNVGAMLTAGMLVLAACGNGAPSAFCDAHQELNELPDPQTAQGQERVEVFENVVTSARRLAENAPEEIRPAAETVREGFEELTDLMRRAGEGDLTQDELEAAQEFDYEAFGRATEEIDAYIEDNC